jgi:steroid delta-isomerase-like uncharacterized protein
MATAAELGTKYFALLSDGRVEAAAALLSPDVRFASPAGSFQGSGPAAAFLQGYFTAFPDARFEIDATTEGGSSAAMEGIYAGTNTGPMSTPAGDVPATGKAVSVPFVTVLETDGERLTAHRAYWDQLGFLTQLGLVPAQG